MARTNSDDLLMEDDLAAAFLNEDETTTPVETAEPAVEEVPQEEASEEEIVEEEEEPIEILIDERPEEEIFEDETIEEETSEEERIEEEPAFTGKNIPNRQVAGRRCQFTIVIVHKPIVAIDIKMVGFPPVKQAGLIQFSYGLKSGNCFLGSNAISYKGYICSHNFGNLAFK